MLPSRQPTRSGTALSHGARPAGRVRDRSRAPRSAAPPHAQHGSQPTSRPLDAHADPPGPAAVAVSSCSTDARTRYRSASSNRTSPSPSESSSTITAASISRVNRGSARAETANPPTSAQRRPCRSRSAAIRRMAASRMFTRICGTAARQRHRQVLPASPSATHGAVPRSDPRSHQDDDGATRNAPSAHRTRTCPEQASAAVQPARRSQGNSS
jgi:hypothetical protein